MAEKNLQDLNRLRKKDFYKDENTEDYLLGINRALQEKEILEYKEFDEEHPTIFVVGLPRSGTTLLTQLLAHAFDVGYINNFMARFWLAPVNGIKLSKIMFGDKAEISFSSKYATTPTIFDIHEFGYFWRYWLKKNNIEQILKSKEIESTIDWDGLKKTILNIHNTFGKGWICKNIYGAYHIEKFHQVLEKSFFVYIERDPLDVAISIQNARKKFFEDAKLWWSTIPLQYKSLIHRSANEQIAGQVQYLRDFYDQELKKIDQQSYIHVNYSDLSKEPVKTLKLIQEKIEGATHTKNLMKVDSLIEIPKKIHFNTYNDQQDEKERYRVLFKQFIKE